MRIRFAVGCLIFASALVADLSQPVAEEKLDRGVIAVVNDARQVYIGWRLLKDDPAGVAFNVYRRTAGGNPVKVNPAPITASTNLVDVSAPLDRDNSWFVRAVVGGREQQASENASLQANSPPNRVRSIKLQGDYLFNRVGICDLDGDGIFDYVIKQPGAGHGLDPGTIRDEPRHVQARGL